MLSTDIGSQGRPVIARTVIAVMMLAMGVTSRIGSASEDIAGVAAARKIIVRDEDLISPSALTMNRGDVLEFQNDSGQFMKLVFVEPPEQMDKIRCYPIDRRTTQPDRTPWTLFDWDSGRRLTATLPPGKFASACALVPGRYAFVATRISRDPRGGDDHLLGTKGTITVQ